MNTTTTNKDTTMKEHEGDANSNNIISISNATIEFQTGAKAITSYDRIIMENNNDNDTPVTVHETRYYGLTEEFKVGDVYIIIVKNYHRHKKKEGKNIIIVLKL